MLIIKRASQTAATGFFRKDKIKLALLASFTMFLFRLVVLISRKFGDVSLDQMIFHLGVNSTTGVPKSLIHSVVVELTYRPLLVFVIVYGMLSIPIVTKYAAHKALFWLCCLGIIINVYFLGDVLKLGEYFETSKFTGDWYQVYAQPTPKELTASVNTRNLVFLYVESLEKFRVASDTTLGKLSAEFGAPKQWYMLPGTQWTLAAMISSQCGIPQMLHGFIGKNNLTNMSHPLQHAVCMADILSAAHYQTLSIDSASPAFAGNGNFLSAHNFAHVRGASDIEAALPKSQLPDWWGVSDAALFEYTKQQITNLAASGKPFYVSLNTMNTHGPEGVLAPSCKKKGFNKNIDAIFDCSVDEAGEFLTWLNAQPFSKNTVVVVMGDHPIMAGHMFKNKLAAPSEPEIFFLIDRPDGIKLPRKNMTHVDIFPTTLAALGFDIPNERLAMGHNIYNSASLVDTIAPQELRKIIRKPSPAYDALW